MRLFERYIFWELLRTFVVGLSISTCMLVSLGVFEKAREFGLGPWQVIQVLPFIIPYLLPFTIPVTLLLTVCMVYGRMAGHQEITAAKAAGVHVFSLLWPSFFLGGVLSLLTLLLADQVIPWSNLNIERTATLALEDIFLDTLRTQNQFSFAESGMSINITVMDLQERTLIMPTVRYSHRGKKGITIQAKRAKLDFDIRQQQVILDFEQGYTKLPGESRIWFQHERREFPLPSRSQQIKVFNLRISDMHRELEATEKAELLAKQVHTAETAFLLATGKFEQYTDHQYERRRYTPIVQQELRSRLNTELHDRYARSMTCLFFVLLGSPFSILMAKKQFLTSFLFCFAPILAFYYPIWIMSRNLSQTGVLDPRWAVWCANAVLFVPGLYVLRRAIR